MDLIINKIQLIHLKKLVNQMNKAKSIIGGFSPEDLNDDLKKEYYSGIVPTMDSIREDIKDYEETFKIFSEDLSIKTEYMKDAISENKKRIKMMEQQITDLDNVISVNLEGGGKLDVNEEYDFINKNILKLNKLMKKHMDEDILNIRNKLLDIDNTDSDSSFIDSDSDSIDDTHYKLNMMKNMQNKGKMQFPLDKINNESVQNEQPIEPKTIISEQNINYKDMAYQYKDAMDDHRNTIKML